MSILTHYLKQRPRGDIEAKLTPVESLLFRLACEDTLFTSRDLYEVYMQEIGSKPKQYHAYTHSNSDIQSMIDELVKKGFFRELHWSRLDRWINSY